MKMLFRSLWLLALSMSAAWAADSGWLPPAQSSHAHIQVRSSAPADGKVRLLLAITLDKGWKTYWRTPGDGGFRPLLTGQHQRRPPGTGRSRCASTPPGSARSAIMTA